MPTPSIDRLAREGMTFFSFYAQPSCTPGRAAMQSGDDGQQTGGLPVDSNLGWKGPDKYVATVPQVFDLWQYPQERYDVFMNNFTEHTWTLVTFNATISELMKTYVKYPPRKLQSEVYTGPITITEYQRFKFIRDLFQKGGVQLPLPTGN